MKTPLVYIVEDDNNISEIESFALKNSGYITEVFETGKIFFKHLQNKKHLSLKKIPKKRVPLIH